MVVFNSKVLHVKTRVRGFILRVRETEHNGSDERQ